VLEFNAPEGVVVLPSYLQQALDVQEGDSLRLHTVELPKGTYAKLQPLTDEYLRVPDFRALLESYLRTHFCTLTPGETILVTQNGLAMEVLVSEVKSSAGAGAGTNAVSIVGIRLLSSRVADSTRSSRHRARCRRRPDGWHAGLVALGDPHCKPTQARVPSR